MAKSCRYLVRLTQPHETFRRPELESISATLGIDLKIIEYQHDAPFCIVEITTEEADIHSLAANFISHSILAKSIHEYYASGSTYDELHEQIKALPLTTWEAYLQSSFRFTIDAYCGKRTTAEQRDIVEGFQYLAFQGPIKMKNPDDEFMVFEEWESLSFEEQSVRNCGHTETDSEQPQRSAIYERLQGRGPRRLFFARFIGGSKRELITKHDLKKRPYISTTSMDAELALVTAVLAKVGPGKLFFDPFTGTGGFMVAASELGAVSLGSDIDGRSFRGKGSGIMKGVGANFKRYGIQSLFGDCITSDLTNTPWYVTGRHCKARRRWLDGIICDPPYGVREGLKVLGRRTFEGSSEKRRHGDDGPYFFDGVASHTMPSFVPPKKPYSFSRMLEDILDFAARTLVDGGRLAFWMPCANDLDEDFPIPQHPQLPLQHSCIQSFNKWSRRLLVYERIPGQVTPSSESNPSTSKGHTADELNPFRKLYFAKFADPNINELKPQP